ncbi:MAG: hypothetical protein VKL39_09380 [Leptolyngbyaceae bacterium]|nr:hypothetical protein [Leptolyngbyaceae bacterium]
MDSKISVAEIVTCPFLIDRLCHNGRRLFVEAIAHVPISSTFLQF